VEKDVESIFMNALQLQTARLRLLVPAPEAVRAGIEAMGATQKAAMSADWLARVRAATTPDPWVLGFSMPDRATDFELGNIGPKSPPNEDGAVELAYMVKPEHQGQGYATEACEAVVDFAFQNGRVRVVMAHTLPEFNASARVLTKCQFQRIGEVVDPEDGLVWRWERHRVGG
jgi:RimJ/RimL family protein N-acetyltransferase